MKTKKRTLLALDCLHCGTCAPFIPPDQAKTATRAAYFPPDFPNAELRCLECGSNQAQILEYETK